MKESSEKLNIEIKSLRIKLEDEISKNKKKDENLYNLTKQLHQIQESYYDFDEEIKGLNQEIKVLRLENESILKEIDLLLKNKKDLETFSKEQSTEIERGIILINNYLKKK